MNIKNFHNVRFPTDISYGSSGGPGFKTSVVELASGHEQRNIEWSLARASYDASYGIKNRDQMEEVLDFFYARRGMAYAFRYKDWMDFQIIRQQIGVTGNTPLQIYKRYEPLTSFSYDRPILKIVENSITIWNNGVQMSAAQVNSRVDRETGLVRVDGYPAGQVIEIECEFDVPVRFATDDIKITHDDYELMSWPSVPLLEVKPRS